MAEAPLPQGKRLNSFTGEVIDEKPLSLAPSPADQRILSMTGDKPLIDLCAEAVAKATGEPQSGHKAKKGVNRNA
jgi:hypothetical protein